MELGRRRSNFGSNAALFCNDRTEVDNYGRVPESNVAYTQTTDRDFKYANVKNFEGIWEACATQDTTDGHKLTP